MARLFSGEVSVSYSQAYLVTDADAPGGMDEWFAGQQSGLVGAAVPGSLFLLFGLHTGDVPVAVHLVAAPPAVGEEWEDVVEVSFHTDTTALRLIGWAGGSADDIELEAPGDYRVR